MEAQRKAFEDVCVEGLKEKLFWQYERKASSFYVREEPGSRSVGRDLPEQDKTSTRISPTHSLVQHGCSPIECPTISKWELPHGRRVRDVSKHPAFGFVAQGGGKSYAFIRHALVWKKGICGYRPRKGSRRMKHMKQKGA